MNKYIRSTGLYAFLFPASLKDSGQTAAEKIEQLKPEFIHRERRLEIYLELFIVFLTAGALLLWIMRFLFNLCVDDWIASGDLRVKDLWNIRHCCKVSDEAAFCLIQRPYISKTLLTRRISPRGSP